MHSQQPANQCPAGDFSVDGSRSQKAARPCLRPIIEGLGTEAWNPQGSHNPKCCAGTAAAAPSPR